jgi:hypothetical protein
LHIPRQRNKDRSEDRSQARLIAELQTEISALHKRVETDEAAVDTVQRRAKERQDVLEAKLGA